MYPTKKNLREIYAYRFQDPKFFKPWLRGERSFSNFAKYFCMGEICGNASIMFEKLTSWFNSSYKCKVLMAQGGLSVAGRCRCLTKDSNTSIEKEGYIPYSLQA